ncbi:MAG: Multi antimicrobial extrusion protein MatE family protein [Haloplasmataceae bacterium]|nr:Multi antimicrobial extrusion protein MatE family protein [Haloplasmataceae bacterium]
MFKKYIADRKFYNQLFVVILPIILQFFIQNFVNFLDNIMVGKLGLEEIEAVAVANQYYKLFYPAITAICTGASIFMAQYFGSKKQKELQKIFGIQLIFPMLITIIFVVVGLVLPEEIIRYFIDDNEEVVKIGVEYLRLAVWSYIPLTLSTAFTFTLRPLKETKIPMYASSIAMLTNFILNLFLINGYWIFPKMGVSGAAVGTIIARVFELLFFIIMFIKKDFLFKTNIFKYFIIDFKILKDVFKKVIPLFINEVSFSVALVYIFAIYSDFGSVAVINIADAISQVIFILASGLGTATSILVGYKLGNNELEEAEKNADYLLGYSVMSGILIMFMVSICAFIVPPFYNVDSEIRRLTTYAILIQGFTAPILMLTRIPFFVLRSGGRVIEILFLDNVFMWIVKVPVAIFFGYVLKSNIIIIFLAVELTRFLNAIISMYFYRQKKWLRNLTK